MKYNHFYQNALLKERGSPNGREFEILLPYRLNLEEYLKIAYEKFGKEKMHKVLALKNKYFTGLDPLFTFVVKEIY